MQAKRPKQYKNVNEVKKNTTKTQYILSEEDRTKEKRKIISNQF